MDGNNLHDESKKNKWSSVCIVIEEYNEGFIGYVPFLKQEVSGSSIDDVKERATKLISEIKIEPKRSATVIAFLDRP